LLPPLAACYTYTTIDPAAARPGMDVRARVSIAAAERIMPLLGSANAREVTGTVIDAGQRAGGGGDTIIVEVPTLVQADIGSSFQTLHQRISISRHELVELEARRLSRGRTALLVGSATIIVVAGVIKGLKGGPNHEALPGGGGTDQRVPLLRIPLP
jgi:hypothetical protein